MLLRHSWHLMCDITRVKGEETIAKSVSCLLNYDILPKNRDQIHDKVGNYPPDPPVLTNVSCL
jgi:hypothetical protein